MTEEKGDALSGQTTLHPAAAKGFGQVEQILHHHVFGKILWLYIGIVNKEITKLIEVTALCVRTVMTNR